MACGAGPDAAGAWGATAVALATAVIPATLPFMTAVPCTLPAVTVPPGETPEAMVPPEPGVGAVMVPPALPPLCGGVATVPPDAGVEPAGTVLLVSVIVL